MSDGIPCTVCGFISVGGTTLGDHTRRAHERLQLLQSELGKAAVRIAELEEAVNLALYVDLEADNSAYQEVLRLFGKEVTDPEARR